MSEKSPTYVNQVHGIAFLENFFVVLRFLADFASPVVFFRIGFLVGVFFRVANSIRPCRLRQAESFTESGSGTTPIEYSAYGIIENIAFTTRTLQSNVKSRLKKKGIHVVCAYVSVQPDHLPPHSVMG